MAYLDDKEVAKRFEGTVLCPNDMAVTGSKETQQARKGCAALLPDTGIRPAICGKLSVKRD